MTAYSIALFVHVLGAITFFMALGMEWVTVLQVQRAATVVQVRERMAGFALMPRLYIPAMVAILLPGLYMTATTWGWDAGWPAVALAAMALLAALGAALTGPRMAAIGRSTATESEPLSPAFRGRLSDPLLRASLRTRTAVAVGIIFLMTVKPNLAGSLLALAVATLLGLASAVPALSGNRAGQPAA
jgi:hypothetical protein